MTDPVNPYLPEVATILETVQETHNIMTFRVRFDDEAKMAAFKFGPGQVGQLSAAGIGESTFVINSPPTRMDYLQFSVMRTGEVTAKLHNLVAGDKVGVRAPLGKPFPVEIVPRPQSSETLACAKAVVHVRPWVERKKRSGFFLCHERLRNLVRPWPVVVILYGRRDLQPSIEVFEHHAVLNRVWY